MGDQFNAEEVLKMAEQIEKNGQEFYRNASIAVDDSEVSRLLSDLAEWEKGHEALFISMRLELSKEEKSQVAIDPYCESAMYLKAMANDHVFRKQTGESLSKLEGNVNTEEIIDRAIQFEKDSLLFFLGLERLVSQRLGKERIHEVIDEEIGHISYLEKQRNKLNSR
ncbi:MAG: ferritin family protein [Candidatus Aegiribacteria sp.]|nr:ferritin family protein [Candidatus Aegiribacteria sp.]